MQDCIFGPFSVLGSFGKATVCRVRNFQSVNPLSPSCTSGGHEDLAASFRLRRQAGQPLQPESFLAVAHGEEVPGRARPSGW